jgi:hypothetical protein
MAPIARSVEARDDYRDVVAPAVRFRLGHLFAGMVNGQVAAGSPERPGAAPFTPSFPL